MSEPVLIATVPKNAREEVRVSLTEYKGYALIDVRTYAEFASAGDGERKPTPKGVSLKVERLPELIAALQAAQSQAGRR
jgi:hypothetical protein